MSFLTLAASIIGWSAFSLSTISIVCNGRDMPGATTPTELTIGNIWKDVPSSYGTGAWSLTETTDQFYHGFWDVDDLSNGPHLEKEFYLPRPIKSLEDQTAQSTKNVSSDDISNNEEEVESSSSIYKDSYSLYVRINFTYTVGCAFSTKTSLLWHAFAVNNERLAFDEFNSFDLSQNPHLLHFSVSDKFPYSNIFCVHQNDSTPGYQINENGVDAQDVWVNLTYSRSFIVDSDDIEESRQENANLVENDEYEPDSEIDVLRIVFGSVAKEESRAVWALHSVSIEVEEAIRTTIIGENGTESSQTVIIHIDDDVTATTSHHHVSFNMNKFTTHTVEHLMNKPWWIIALVIVGLLVLLLSFIFAVYKLIRFLCGFKVAKQDPDLPGLGIEGIDSIDGTEGGGSGTSLSTRITVSGFPWRRQRRTSVFDGIDASVIAPDRDMRHNTRDRSNSNYFINSIIMSSDDARGAWRRDVPDFEDGFDSDGETVSPGVSYSTPTTTTTNTTTEKSTKHSKQKNKFPMFSPSKLPSISTVVNGVTRQKSSKEEDNYESVMAGVQPAFERAGNGSRSVRSTKSNGSGYGSAGGNRSRHLSELPDSPESDECQNAEDIMGMISIANDVVDANKSSDDSTELPSSVLHKKSPSDVESLMASLDALESRSRATMSTQNSRANTPRTWEISGWKSIFGGGSRNKSKNKSSHKRDGSNSSASSSVSIEAVAAMLRRGTGGSSAGTTHHAGSYTPTNHTIDSNFDIPDNASELSDIDYQGLFLRDIAKQTIESDLHALNKLSEMNENDDEQSSLTGLDEGSNASNGGAEIIMGCDSSSNDNINDDIDEEHDPTPPSTNISKDSTTGDKDSNSNSNKNKDSDSDSGLFEWVANKETNKTPDKLAKMRARRARMLRNKRKKQTGVGHGGNYPNRLSPESAKSSASNSGTTHIRNSNNKDGNAEVAVSLSVNGAIMIDTSVNGSVNKSIQSTSRNLSDCVTAAEIIYGDSDDNNNNSDCSKSKSTSADCIDTSVSDNEMGETNMMMEHVLLADDNEYIANTSGTGGFRSGNGARNSCNDNDHATSDDSESFDIANIDNTNNKKRKSDLGNFKFAMQTTPDLNIGAQSGSDDDDGTTIVLSTYSDYKISPKIGGSSSSIYKDDKSNPKGKNKKTKDKKSKKKLPLLATLSEL